MDVSLTQDELQSALREIAAARPSSPSELLAIQARCSALSKQLTSQRHLADQVPELVWHFLADADIRYKDPRYAEIQFTQMDSFLASDGTSAA